MKLQNENVRELARHAGIPLWAVAHQLQISEATLFRWLRFPLSEEKDRRIKEAISSLEKEVG